MVSIADDGNDSLELQLDDEVVRRATSYVAHEALSAGLSERAAHHCELAVDEICTNVLEHGFGTQPKPHARIKITTRMERDAFCIEICDTCLPFDPLKVPPNQPEDLDDLQTHGWGLHIVKKVIDKLKYEYRDGKNHLVLYKYIS